MRLPARPPAFLALALLAASPTIAQIPANPEMPTKPQSVGPRVQSVERVGPPVATMDAAPQPLGYEHEIYCYGYLASGPQTFPARLVGAEAIAEQIDFIDHDLLYVNGGIDVGFKVGDEFWFVTPEQDVTHPVTGASLGRLYQYRGRGVIETVLGRTSTMRVTQTCTDIPLGSYLKPFEPVPIPLARKTPPAMPGDPPSGKSQGMIVHTPNNNVALGADHTVMVNLGVAEGLEPGDFLTVYRYTRGRPAGREIGNVGANWVRIKDTGVMAAQDVPRTYLGEIAILMVGDRWAIGRITDSYRLMEMGDEVELK